MANSERILEEVIVTIAKKLKYVPLNSTITPISSGGANFTSTLFRATLTAPEKDDLNMFAKVSAAGEKTENLSARDIFKTEIYVYNQLLNMYKDMEEKFKIPNEHRLATAIIYGSNEQYLKKVLILEDLTKKGYQEFDRFKTMDYMYACQSVKQLAIFHALSLALSKYDSKEFDKTKDVLKFHFDVRSALEYLKVLINNTIHVVKEENKERLYKYMESKMEASYYDAFFKPMKCSIIIHGDYRPSNLMHKVNDDGSLEVIPLDYQTIRHGSPIFDLLFLLFMGSDKKFREQHMSAIIELYYNELCNALRRFDIEPDTVYKREDFDYEYNKILQLGPVQCWVSLLIVTVETEMAPKVGEDIGPIDFSSMKPSDGFKERFNDLIDDFIQLGVL